jgi:hypothetical protein
MVKLISRLARTSVYVESINDERAEVNVSALSFATLSGYY